MAVAVATRQFCSLIGKKAFAEEAFLAGLIHDLGLLVERQAFPDQLADTLRLAAKGDRPFCDVETEVTGTDHQALGAALANKWKFPRGLQTVIGYHHKIDTLSEEHRLLPTVVYAADVLCCHERHGLYLTAQGQPLDDILLESIGLTETDFNAVREALPEMVADAEALFASPG